MLGDPFPIGVMVGQTGNQCNGDGTCLPARLHTANAKCPKCGGGSFDHATDSAQEAWCLNCGTDYDGPIPE